jgi:hypothetical protein
MQQPTPPIIQALSNQYRSLDWLYADTPEQLLGLPAPLWPLHVQPPPVGTLRTRLDPTHNANLPCLDIAQGRSTG